jgi:hypothetical protein
VLRLEKVAPDLGRMMGVKEEDLRSDAEAGDMKQQIMKMAAERAAQIMAENAPKNAAPPAAAPEQGMIQ